MKIMLNSPFPIKRADFDAFHFEKSGNGKMERPQPPNVMSLFSHSCPLSGTSGLIKVASTVWEMLAKIKCVLQYTKVTSWVSGG